MLPVYKYVVDGVSVSRKAGASRDREGPVYRSSERKERGWGRHQGEGGRRGEEVEGEGGRVGSGARALRALSVEGLLWWNSLACIKGSKVCRGREGPGRGTLGDEGGKSRAYGGGGKGSGDREGGGGGFEGTGGGPGGGGEGRRVVLKKCRRHEEAGQIHGPADTCASK